LAKGFVMSDMNQLDCSIIYPPVGLNTWGFYAE